MGGKSGVRKCWWHRDGMRTFAWESLHPSGLSVYLGRTIHEVRVWASGEGGAP